MRPTDDELMEMCGGRPKQSGGESVKWFGMNPSESEHTEAAVVPFNDDPKIPKVMHQRVCLWKFGQQLKGGKHPQYNWQLTGSCVNGGANNCLSVLIAKKIARDGAAGSHHIPFTLPAYGESRRMNGWTSPGEGSTGDSMALALQNLGYTAFDSSISGMPSPKMYENAYCYSKQIELQFSAAKGCPQTVKDACSAHKLTFEKLTTLEQCELSIRRCNPFTIAGNWGSRMEMKYRGTGENRILFGDYADSWEHQQSCIGMWLHPEFGRLWFIMNQWYYVNSNGAAVPVHGLAGTDEPQGGYWVDDSMLQHQLNYRWGELRAYVNDVAFDDGTLSTLAV